jgi:hypothetical protein
MSEPVAPSPSAAAPGQLYNQPSGSPSAKVAATGISGVGAVVVIWLWSILQRSVPDLPEMPPEVAAGLTALLGFIVGYLKRDRA